VVKRSPSAPGVRYFPTNKFLRSLEQQNQRSHETKQLITCKKKRISSRGSYLALPLFKHTLITVLIRFTGVKAGIECTGRKEAPSGSNAFYTFAIRPGPSEASQRKNLSTLHQRGAGSSGSSSASKEPSTPAGSSLVFSPLGEGSLVQRQNQPCSFCRYAVKLL
jgi:hypothetical protein